MAFEKFKVDTKTEIFNMKMMFRHTFTLSKTEMLKSHRLKATVGVVSDQSTNFCSGRMWGRPFW